MSDSDLKEKYKHIFCPCGLKLSDHTALCGENPIPVFQSFPQEVQNKMIDDFLRENQKETKCPILKNS